MASTAVVAVCAAPVAAEALSAILVALRENDETSVLHPRFHSIKDAWHGAVPT